MRLRVGHAKFLFLFSFNLVSSHLIVRIAFIGKGTVCIGDWFEGSERIEGVRLFRFITR